MQNLKNILPCFFLLSLCFFLLNGCSTTPSRYAQANDSKPTDFEHFNADHVAEP
ncbi:MAG: hypothetical protein K0S63_898, partial [Gammaproteobacteria bacterium]|nr:hypothetical protein [Gammaproteobacteria bacterium]